MLSRYDPFDEAMSLRQAMDRLFAQSFIRPGFMADQQAAFTPMDVSETDQGYQLRVAIPGYKPEDVELTLHSNTLTVKGQYQSSTESGDTGQTQNQTARQEQGQAGNVLMREIHTGSFERSITFARPVDADKIQTQYEHGILTVTAPFSEAGRPRRIPVSGSRQRQAVPGPGQQATETEGTRQEISGSASSQSAAHQQARSDVQRTYPDVYRGAGDLRNHAYALAQQQVQTNAASTNGDEFAVQDYAEAYIAAYQNAVEVRDAQK